MTDDQIQSAKQSLATITVGQTGLSMTDLATVFVKSGFFKDVKEQAQAVVKVLLGQELGLQPIQAMMGIHIVEGKPEISAALMAALVKRSGRYDYEVKHHDDEGCAIEFFALEGGKRPVGVSEFTIHDAQRAGLASRGNWKAYPRNMCFARAMSNGVKWYCGDAVGGLPIYTDGEISDAPQKAADAAASEPAYTGDGLLHGSETEQNPFMPKEKLPAPGEGKPAETTARDSDPPAPQPQPGAGSTKERTGRPRGRGPATTEQAAAPSDLPKPQTEEAPSDILGDKPGTGKPKVVFTIDGADYITAGITEEQMRKTFDLVRRVTPKKGKGYAREVLAKILGCAVEDASRTDATEEQAAQLIKELEQALA